MSANMRNNGKNGSLRDCDRELLDACGKLDVAGVLSAIEAGANANVEDGNSTPLYKTMFGDDDILSDDNEEEEINLTAEEIDAKRTDADRRRTEIFGMLIANGADVNKIPRGEFPLLWDAVHHKPCVAECLLKNGADPNLALDPDKDGFTYTDTPLSHAWTDEDVIHIYGDDPKEILEIQRLLLAYGARPYTDAEIAGECLDLRKIRDFDDVPAETFPQELENLRALSEDEEALFKACAALDVDGVAKLLEEGCNPNVRDYGKGGMTPLCKVADARTVKKIEDLLTKYGGCSNRIFDDCESDAGEADRALVYACQRLDYRTVQVAARLGGDLSYHTKSNGRCLPLVAICDAPQLKTLKARTEGWGPVESMITDFVLFLLAGMDVPISEKDIDGILRACVFSGFEELAETLLSHHVLGARFRARAGNIRTEGFPWDVLAEEKREKMLRIFGMKEEGK